MSISISEILVVLVVALLVIKPENLPETALTLGKWVKWLRTTTNQFKQDWEVPLKELSDKSVSKQTSDTNEPHS